MQQSPELRAVLEAPVAHSAGLVLQGKIDYNESTMKAKNLSKILSSYKNEWLALSHNESKVIASSKSAKKAYLKAKDRGEERPIMMKAPKKWGIYVLFQHDH